MSSVISILIVVVFPAPFGPSSPKSSPSPISKDTPRTASTSRGLRHGGVYKGLDEVRRNIFDPLDRDWWAEFAADPEEFVDGGDQVVVLGRYRGIAKGTGKRLDVPFVHVWTLKDGKAVRFRQFL